MICIVRLYGENFIDSKFDDEDFNFIGTTTIDNSNKYLSNRSIHTPNDNPNVKSKDAAANPTPPSPSAAVTVADINDKSVSGIDEA